MATKNTTKNYEVKVVLPDHSADKKVPMGTRGVLTIKLTYKPTKGFRSVHLRKHSAPLLTLSIVGNVRYGLRGGDCGGQCIGEIRRIWGHIPEVSELCDLWERWHLNDIQAGTVKQMVIIRKMGKCPVSSDWYTWACLTLKTHDLLVDRGYTFGREWLFEMIPAKVVSRIKTLAKTIDPRP